jgi:hypothetical protein
MSDLSTDDYRAMAESYEAEPPRSDELIGEPVLNPRPDREPDAVTGELSGPAAAAGGAYARGGRRCLNLCVRWVI